MTGWQCDVTPFVWPSLEKEIVVLGLAENLGNSGVSLGRIISGRKINWS
jgi:hypothetical protein